MPKRPQKINHSDRIMNEIKLPELSILPGMVIRFAYNKPKVWDRRPLVFVMHVDRGKQQIEGVNLNYLHEARVQRFFKQAQGITPMLRENLVGLPDDYYRIQLSSHRKPTATDGKLLYKMVMPRDTYYKNAYRTYSFGSATAMKVVDYDYDIVRTTQGRMSPEAAKRRGKIDDGDITEGL